MIGVLTNAVRAMLHDSGLPQILWVEVYNAATYVHNRTPTRGRTLYEVLYGAKLVVSHSHSVIVEPKEA